MTKENVLQKIAELRQSDEGRSLWSAKPSNEWAWYLSLRGYDSATNTWKPNTLMVRFHQLKVDEEYLLLDGCGSIYKNGNSVGYFRAGTIVKVLSKDNDIAEVSLKGNTFRVTSDASFANASSTFAITEGV